MLAHRREPEYFSHQAYRDAGTFFRSSSTPHGDRSGRSASVDAVQTSPSSLSSLPSIAPPFPSRQHRPRRSEAANTASDSSSSVKVEVDDSDNDALLPTPASEAEEQEFEAQAVRAIQDAEENLLEVERLLEVATAQRDICYAEEALAKCRVNEMLVRTRLFRLRAAIAAKKSKNANFNVGRARGVVSHAYRAAWTQSGGVIRRSAPPALTPVDRVQSARCDNNGSSTYKARGYDLAVELD